MIFKVKDGSFGYGDKLLFNNVNFSLEKGEILSILGANGVGKTTLLRCMMGLLPWKNGFSQIDNTIIKKDSENSIWKKIGYVPQAKNSVSPLLAKEFVLLGKSSHLNIFAQPSSKARKDSLEAMEKINIGHLANKACNKMSGGELQMVLIARALCINPKMLILDEPESNLDFKNQLMVLNTIEKLAREEGISSIMNTHYPSHALQISNKSLLLNSSGENLFGLTKSVINEQTLKSIFKVDVKIIENTIENRTYVSIVPLYKNYVV